VVRRDPRSARLLGLWTAAWLAALLLGGLLWLGDISLQWPVLAVPVLWAAWALRPRRRNSADPGDYDDDEDDWEPIPRMPPGRPPPGERTDTVERPALRRRDEDGY
jgi:hypothetical protein